MLKGMKQTIIGEHGSNSYIIVTMRSNLVHLDDVLNFIEIPIKKSILFYDITNGTRYIGNLVPDASNVFIHQHYNLKKGQLEVSFCIKGPVWFTNDKFIGHIDTILYSFTKDLYRLMHKLDYHTGPGFYSINVIALGGDKMFDMNKTSDMMLDRFPEKSNYYDTLEEFKEYLKPNPALEDFLNYLNKALHK